ncbi:MAG: hypothetical protein ACD_40C00018G0002 [uncultured bacterium]|nr:MAG: hypothetical protein ACD_40C00018G0002 [uncultured bacterium]KKU25834.1 MAG: Peptide deformylase [Microgenomates group bacterium GW2011_GWA2_46_16]
MGVRDTIQVGNPILKSKNLGITDFSDPKIKQVIIDLIDTMHDQDLIGMAAPQIYVTEPRETATRPKDQSDDLRVYINPKIINCSEEKVEIWEGCGCAANGSLFAPVIRPKIITVEATDQDGSIFQITADGILGRVIQHEQDHMIGVEFVEKISDYSRLMSKESYIQLIKPRPETKAPCIITIKQINLRGLSSQA